MDPAIVFGFYMILMWLIIILVPLVLIIYIVSWLIRFSRRAYTKALKQ